MMVSCIKTVSNVNIPLSLRLRTIYSSFLPQGIWPKKLFFPSNGYDMGTHGTIWDGDRESQGAEEAFRCNHQHHRIETWLPSFSDTLCPNLSTRILTSLTYLGMGPHATWCTSAHLAYAHDVVLITDSEQQDIIVSLNKAKVVVFNTSQLVVSTLSFTMQWTKKALFHLMHTWKLLSLHPFLIQSQEKSCGNSWTSSIPPSKAKRSYAYTIWQKRWPSKIPVTQNNSSKQA